MRKYLILPVLAVMIAALTGCTIKTLPMHDPIYPGSGENVTYSIKADANDGIVNVKLFETVSSINAAGTVTPGVEALVLQWNPAGSPASVTLSYTKTNGYTANKLIKYRFEVKNGKNQTRSHDVTYAVRPYPVNDQPVPVYAQGDVDHLFDVVFIPDTDITNLPVFYGHCRSMIQDSVFAETHVRPWSRQFNFYINPLTGHATDYDLIAVNGHHQKPSNWSNLSFAEVKVLMHRGDLRDYAMGDLFSTEQQNRGTMMHEGGHSMFGLADEYVGGSHWQAAVFPNNWSNLAGAQADAPSRHKTAADAVKIGADPWYKICTNSCTMRVSGVILNGYDDPCGDRAVYSIIDNAINQ